MEWNAWARTHENCDEYTAWDVSDSWFVSVERRGPLWFWHAAHAPGDGDALWEKNSWCFTKRGAFAEAKVAAEIGRKIESPPVSLLVGLILLGILLLACSGMEGAAMT